MDINKRIVKFCIQKRIKKSFLTHSGYGSKQTIYHIWNGLRKPSCIFLEKLVDDNPDLNARWLLTGKGKMIITTDN